MIRRLFLDHPQSVNESYVEHFQVASSFGVMMIFGGLCALIHAFVPGWCVTTGSNILRKLNRRIIEQRQAKGMSSNIEPQLDWVI